MCCIIYSFKYSFTLFSGISIENSNVDFLESESAVLSCLLADILEDATITWYNGLLLVASDDTTNYVISDGTYDEDADSKSSELEIKPAKLGALADSSFKCSATVGEDTLQAVTTLQVFSEL